MELEKIADRLTTLENKINELNDSSLKNICLLEENYYANIFSSTITDSTWWHYEISPGNMAVGYSFLYSLYRILDEIQPKNILEIGLGQSSLMVTAYGSTHDCNHVIIEHDKEWISFFEHKLHGNNYSIFTPNLIKPNIEGYLVNMYDDISPVAEGQKYDLIIIDGPFGSPDISRIDTLNYMSEILSDNFIIMLHDAERPGEQNTIKMLENLLKEDGIDFHHGYKPGIAYTYIATSPSRKFICSL